MSVSIALLAFDEKPKMQVKPHLELSTVTVRKSIVHTISKHPTNIPRHTPGCNPRWQLSRDIPSWCHTYCKGSIDIHNIISLMTPCS